MVHPTCRKSFHRTCSIRFTTGLLTCLTAVLPIPPATGAESAPRAIPPNILLIVADDLSPENFGFHGGARIPTPNLDRLAAHGVVFENVWTTPMCMPSRAQILSGSNASRNGIWHNQLNVRPDGKNPQEYARHQPTIAPLLKKAGYRTALAGKAHTIGTGMAGTTDLNPSKAGYDEWSIFDSSGKLAQAQRWETENTPAGFRGPVASRHWQPSIYENGKARMTTPNDFGDDLFADFLLDFMKRCAGQGKPSLAIFMMNLPHVTALSQLPTTPLSGEPGKNEGGTFEECVAYIDVIIGRMIEQMETIGILDNTVVLFTTDNADVGFGKAHIVEQGARVPLVIAGPEQYIGKTRRSTALVSLADLLPTFCDWAGVEVPTAADIDGKNYAPYLRGESGAPRSWLYSYLGTGAAIRDAEWVLEAYDPIGGHEGRLYRYLKPGGNILAPGRELISENTTDPEALAARTQFIEILKEIHRFDVNNPHIIQALERYRGAAWPHRLTPASPRTTR
jgi:arylsulfatase A